MLTVRHLINFKVMSICTGKCPMCEKMAYIVDRESEIGERVETCDSSSTYICYSRKRENTVVRDWARV